jgi:transposase InsO family protein
MIKEIHKKSKTKRWGGRKLYSIIGNSLKTHNIKMGRDKFFDLLCSEGMLVKPRKRNYFTTDSHHWLRKYDYLIDGMELTAPNQLWVSDITYVESVDTALYLYLITDAYFRLIMTLQK